MSATDRLDAGPAVRLRFSPALNKQSRDRLSVCDGVRLTHSGQRWIARPTDSWRPPSAEEIGALEKWPSSTPSFGADIGLFEMATEAIARTADFLEWYFAAPVRAIAECRDKERQVGLLGSIYSGHDAESTFMGVSSGPPNQSTVAVHRDAGDPVGLHLDNYDNLPILERANARNRICLNVGPQKRYLLFLGFQARYLLSTVLANEDMPDKTTMLRDHRELVARYFRLLPDSRVYRIEIRPGEGYVAPTENVVHEGSTLGTSARDYSMVWLGRFQWVNVKARTVEGRPSS